VVKCRQCGRSVSLPLANRSVLQTNQAKLAVVRFPGQQRQRGPLAGLDGVVALRADAFSVRDERLEPLFHQALHAATSRALEKIGSVGFAQILWDSRWTFSVSCYAAERLFPGIRLAKLWDSIKTTLKKFPLRKQKNS
jgi:hypothetical protein